MQHDAVLVLFTGPTTTAYNDEAVTVALKQETSRSLAPDAVYLLCPTATVDANLSNQLRQSLDSVGIPKYVEIGVYSYDQDGKLTLCSAMAADKVDEVDDGGVFVGRIRRQGLTQLFRRHGAVIYAGPTAHFVRPSKRCSNHFYRASQALSDGAGIYFVALWLLPYLTDKTTFVHLDTSTIASVVFAALLLKAPHAHPTVVTFQSYDHLEGHQFGDGDLVIISASQSGEMKKCIASKGVNLANVLTLFSSAPAPDKQVLCDIRYDADTNVAGYQFAEDAVSSPPMTRPIRIISEHFVVGTEEPRMVVPGIKDAPKVIKEVLAKLVGSNVLVALKRPQDSSPVVSVWFDMNKFVKLEVFQQEWIKKTVARHVPATTRAIITSADGQSIETADSLDKAVIAQGGKLAAQRLTPADLGKKHAWPDSASPVVILSGPAGRGAELLSISRALRTFAKDSHRIFMVPGIIGTSQRAIDLLDRNLTQGGHQFHRMFDLVIDRETAAESWQCELQLLKHLPQADCIQKRIESLEANAGRTNDMFLASLKHDEQKREISLDLTLRDNFAFWPNNKNCTDASHADVYTTICALLENLRSDSTSLDRRLINDMQTHTVLDAETFTRFNDGVIQAAFLRAAHPIELNYKTAPLVSRIMLDLLRQMIQLKGQQQGEALAEFLLSIACKRMCLVDTDHVKLQADLKADRQKRTSATTLYDHLADAIIRGDVAKSK